MVSKWAVRVVFLVAAVAVCLSVAVAEATVYGFRCITDNKTADAAIGEAQLFVDVHNGGNEVHFRFWNIGNAACSITDVYFEDGTLLTMDTITDADDGGGHEGVDFERNAKPGDLPGGNAVGFQATQGFTADSDPPVPFWGVEASDPGDEWLDILFTLDPCATVEDVYDELSAETLRIGIHVQSFDGGGSESFVNNIEPSPGPIPEPMAMSLLVLGATALLRKRRI